MTALMVAAGNQWEGPFGNDAVETVLALLEAGADVNAVDEAGDTVLARIEDNDGDYGSAEIAVLLKSAGATRSR